MLAVFEGFRFHRSLYMCILSVCRSASSRWPFIFAHNRDEYVSRPTAPLALDEATGVLWAFDVQAGGGSWLGFNTRTGSFAALTNCRRAPTTVPQIPFEEIVKRCQINDDGLVMFTADASRGALIRQFLETQQLPPAVPWDHPMMEGFNLVTVESLYAAGTTAPGEVRLTSNRYEVPHGVALPNGTAHALSNSYINNPQEPKTEFLRCKMNDLVGELQSSPDSFTAPTLTDAIGELLCARNAFEVTDEAVLSASRPFAEMTTEQKTLLSNAVRERCPSKEISQEGFVGNWNTETEKQLHQGVFVTCGPSYRTRTQTVVLVENQEGTLVVHFSMRNCESPTLREAWTYHRFSSPQK